MTAVDPKYQSPRLDRFEAIGEKSDCTADLRYQALQLALSHRLDGSTLGDVLWHARHYARWLIEGTTPPLELVELEAGPRLFQEREIRAGFSDRHFADA